MSEVVVLDDEDDVGTIQGKLGAAKADRIVLVVPKGLESLRNPVRFQLVIRHAHALAKDLVLVIEDRKTRELAKGHGLAVFRSRRILRRHVKLERVFRGGPVNPARGLVRPLAVATLPGLAVAVFVVGLLALPVVGGYVLLPTATVTIAPVSQIVSDTVTITATRGLNSVQLSRAEVPARVVQVSVTGTDRVTATGKRAQPENRATGQATFMNKLGGEVVVPKGTLVTTAANEKFLTVDDLTLQASAWSTGRVGLIAAEAGPKGNVAALTINQIVDPELAQRVTVLNENPTMGGTEKQAIVVSAVDRNRVKGILLDKLKVDGLQALDGQKKETETIYAQTVNLVVIEEEFDRNVDEESDEVSLRLRVNLNGLAFESGHVKDLASGLLKNRLPADTQVLSSGVKTQPGEVISWNNDQVVFATQVQAATVNSLDEAKTKRRIRGLTRAEAEAVLAQSLELAKPPRVELEPPWVSTVPWLEFRIQLKIVPAA